MKYEKEIFIVSILLIFGAFAYLALSSGVQTIIPSAGIGGSNSYALGETVHWQVALNAQDGIPLFSQLGCGNANYYTPVTVIGQTTLICDGNVMGGTNLQAPGMSCNFFQGSNAAVMFSGEATATIPASAYNCYISNLFTANMNSNPNVYAQREDSTNSGQLVLYSPPACTNGQVMCFGSQPKACVNGQWQQNDICSNGCLNGQCIQVCTPGALQCNGNGGYQTCTPDGEWGAITWLNSPLYCQSNQIVKLCPNGNYIPQADTCPGNNPPPVETKTCPTGQVIPINDACPPYCGDGLCNAGETSLTCLGDCPIQPTPGNGTIGNQTGGQNTTYPPGNTTTPPGTVPPTIDVAAWISKNIVMLGFAAAFLTVVGLIAYFGMKKR